MMPQEPSPASVNLNDLATECALQSQHYLRYATMLADAKLAVNEAEAELDVVKAELSLAIRDSPSDFGLPKATEDAVKLAIPLQGEYRMALRALNQAKHHHDVVKAMVGALDHKKPSLESLVYLHGQGYNAEPKPRQVTANGHVSSRRALIEHRTKPGEENVD